MLILQLRYVLLVLLVRVGIKRAQMAPVRKHFFPPHAGNIPTDTQTCLFPRSLGSLRLTINQVEALMSGKWGLSTQLRTFLRHLQASGVGLL